MKSVYILLELFEINEIQFQKKYNLKIHLGNSTIFGDNSLRSLAMRVWNSLPILLILRKSQTGVFPISRFLVILL